MNAPKSTARKLLTAAALIGSAMFMNSSANAAVYNPFDAIGSSEQVLSVTPGYTASWWVEDGTAGTSPANDSPATIESFTESLVGSNITGANNTGCPGSSREGLGSLTGTNDKCIGNIFTIKVNDLGYLVFVYASALGLGDFDIAMNEPRSNLLSNMNIYNSSPSEVPVPGAIIFMLSGFAGLGALARKKQKA